MFSARSSTNRAGFTLLELLLALAILGVLSTLALNAFTQSLNYKRHEDLRLKTQQNLRAALHYVTQDLRSGAYLHVWHQSPCDATRPCSNHTQVAIVGLTGDSSPVAEPPGNSFTNSAETGVCDARAFQEGDLVLLYNGDQVQLLRITQRQLLADPNQPCSGPPNPNRDKIQHNQDRISGQWTNSAYVFKVDLATYVVRDDPLEAGRKVLYRMTGYGTRGAGAETGYGDTMTGAGIVAFGITGLEVWYGVPEDPNAQSSRLVFYPTLEEAASAFSAQGYSATPGGGKYIGTLVRAVRVALTGQSPGNLPGKNAPDTLTVTETVELRR
ncbi:MAG: prepilin-type N-terminal cleavage/methylation domain-containing protein [Thermus antranikianii]|nr:MAG: prepilin-type N-terminal cleavage/methylation domain-containing protein [Thermus antranikianii]